MRRGARRPGGRGPKSVAWPMPSRHGASFFCQKLGGRGGVMQRTEMTASRCQPPLVDIVGARPRIPYYPLPWGDLNAACADCGVGPGAWHRPGCRGERCPSCGDRAHECGRAEVERRLAPDVRGPVGPNRSGGGRLARIPGSPGERGHAPLAPRPARPHRGLAQQIRPVRSGPVRERRRDRDPRGRASIGTDASEVSRWVAAVLQPLVDSQEQQLELARENGALTERLAQLEREPRDHRARALQRGTVAEVPTGDAATVGPGSAPRRALPFGRPEAVRSGAADETSGGRLRPGAPDGMSGGDHVR